MASNTSIVPGLDTANQEEKSKVTTSAGISLTTFLASISVAAVAFAIQIAVFLIIRERYARIYRPRTYLVPQKERTEPPPRGFLTWIPAVFKTSNAEFMQKCGLDAYFFVRFLRTLLRIFIPLACVVLPVLLPINLHRGRGASFAVGKYSGFTNVTGLDQLAFGNVRPEHTSRYWAHFIMALIVITYVCYVVYDELRGYIRVRQAYLTSPQHRLRASATTVLVTGIPARWLSEKALDGLYDVFPGGVRNIWINRNYDELQDKVKLRDKLARILEEAETTLIKKAKKAQLKQLRRQQTKGDRAEQRKKDDAEALQMAQTDGLASGDPHQVKHNLYEATHEGNGPRMLGGRKPWMPVPVVGQGITTVGRGLNRFGQTVVQGLRQVEDDVGERLNPTGGFDPSLAVDGQQSRRSPFESTDETHVHPALRAKSPHSVGDVKTSGQTATDCAEQPRAQDEAEDGVQNAVAFNDEYDRDRQGEPVWKRYLRENDRETMRTPLVQKSWMPSLPLVGEKVDTIYYCRRMVAQLNLEIERDQRHPERYPLMNSAFVQFNEQIAAHMACQSVNHHVPKHMAPRVVEISPNDVIWDNMSLRWWERYLRTGFVVVLVGGLIVGWAVPVAFTGFLSQLDNLASFVSWLKWLEKIPKWLKGLIQGVLPPVLLAGLMALLPVILRFFVKEQGLANGMGVELSIQNYYFAFLFVQVFLVVSITSGISTALRQLIKDVASGPALLATSLPRASNYFFSYMVLQAFSVSAGGLLQIASLFSWFILSPMIDFTARQKWRRQTTIPHIQWGTFFPVYTNLAAIGLTYSVISPLILLFNIMTFFLFWVAYRYNTLYVIRFRFDTGGRLFPRAINQLFTGLYVMELCMIGLFFLVRDDQDRVACRGQGIAMIVVTVFTVIYQFLLNEAFGPLLTYLPITLEDDAAERDRLFAKAQMERLSRATEGEDGDDGVRDMERVLAERERRERSEDHPANSIELKEMEAEKEPRAHRGLHLPWRSGSTKAHKHPSGATGRFTNTQDLESQSGTNIGRVLFDHIPDQIEDLLPEERDALVRRAFLHQALRARRPVIWIPRDNLGVSDDEIRRTRQFSEHIWISNEYTGLDSKCRVVYQHNPPDFSEVDLIEL